MKLMCCDSYSRPELSGISIRQKQELSHWTEVNWSEWPPSAAVTIAWQQMNDVACSAINLGESHGLLGDKVCRLMHPALHYARHESPTSRDSTELVVVILSTESGKEQMAARPSLQPSDLSGFLKEHLEPREHGH